MKTKGTATRAIISLTKLDGVTSASITFIANHACWDTLMQETKMDLYDWSKKFISNGYDPKEIYELAWAMTTSYRRFNTLSRIELLELLPEDPEGWESFRETLVGLMNGSFLFRNLRSMAEIITNYLSKQAQSSLGLPPSDSLTPSE